MTFVKCHALCVSSTSGGRVSRKRHTDIATYRLNLTRSQYSEKLRLNNIYNKTGVIRADILDLNFDFEDIIRFGNISVFGTCQFWWHLWFVKFQFLWQFSFGDNSVLVKLQFWWHFSVGDISVLVTFQFW